MQQLTQSHTDILKQQQFDSGHPGTILADFEALLDFIGVAGLKTGGKNFRIPLAALNDLDERMTVPLRPKMERPQQLSFPHLNGLYLVFRSSGLGVASGQGASGRLSVNPNMLAQWRTLNPVEQYVTLFHAMLAAEWSLITSERGSHGPFQELGWKLDYWCLKQELRNKSSVSAAAEFMGWMDQTVAALLELFGILEIPRVAPLEGENWRFTSVHSTDFGQAFLTRLRHPAEGLDLIEILFGRTDGTKKWLGDLFREEFPNCRNTLSTDEGEFVDGIWQFKVSWGKVWRRILIPADLSTQELVDGILTAYEFDSDHLYDLVFRDRSGRNIKIGHEALDDIDYYCDEFAIGSLPLDPGQTMQFRYDFGDNWQFQVKLEKILPPDESVTELRIAERHGEAPKQYDYGDDEDDFDYEDDGE